MTWPQGNKRTCNKTGSSVDANHVVHSFLFVELHVTLFDATETTLVLGFEKPALWARMDFV